MKSNSISIISNRRRISLSPEEILYVQLVGRQSVIHISGGKTYETYTTIDDLEQMLGSGFLRADRATEKAGAQGTTARRTAADRTGAGRERRSYHAGRIPAALCQL